MGGLNTTEFLYGIGAKGKYNHNNGTGGTLVEGLTSSRTNLYWLEVSHKNEDDIFIQLFNSNGTVVLGVDKPTLSIMVPAGDGTYHGGVSRGFAPSPIEFTDGLKYAITTNVDNDVEPASLANVNIVYSL